MLPKANGTNYQRLSLLHNKCSRSEYKNSSVAFFSPKESQKQTVFLSASKAAWSAFPCSSATRKHFKPAQGGWDQKALNFQTPGTVGLVEQRTNSPSVSSTHTPSPPERLLGFAGTRAHRNNVIQNDEEELTDVKQLWAVPVGEWRKGQVLHPHPWVGSIQQPLTGGARGALLQDQAIHILKIGLFWISQAEAWLQFLYTGPDVQALRTCRHKALSSCQEASRQHENRCISLHSIIH